MQYLAIPRELFEEIVNFLGENNSYNKVQPLIQKLQNQSKLATEKPVNQPVVNKEEPKPAEQK